MSEGDAARLGWAQAFLQEAVYRSRQAQAGAGLWAAGDPSRADCGLGERAVVALDLTPEAEGLFARLWPDSLDEASVARLRARMTAWVERQDALDRDRNHFLKAFRRQHGLDRRAYDAEQLAAFEAGLEAVNRRVDEERARAAGELLTELG